MRFWLASTNSERKIASSETSVVSSGKGNVSKEAMPGIEPVLIASQAPNHNTWATSMPPPPAIRVMVSLICSARDRFSRAACSQILIVPMLSSTACDSRRSTLHLRSVRLWSIAFATNARPLRRSNRLECQSMFRGRVIVAASLIAVASGCSKPVELPPVASVAFTASRPRVAIGSPVDLTYTFEVLPNAVINGDYTVFVHLIDARGDMIWADDHDPPVKTSQWKPGQKIGPYTRTRFIPPYRYIGQTSVVVGLY